MKTEYKLSLDQKSLNIFIPIRLGRKSGRKTIMAPNGQPINPDRNAEQDSTLRNALVNAHKWQRLFESGKFKNLAALAKHVGYKDHASITKIIKLTLLAPDIQEAILNGIHPTTLCLADLKKPFSMDWEEQRDNFQFDQQ